MLQDAQRVILSGFVHDMSRKYLEMEKSGADFEALEALTLGGLKKSSAGRRYQKRKSDGRPERRTCKGKSFLQGDYQQNGFQG